MKYIINIGLGLVFVSSTLLLVSVAEGQTQAQSQDQSSLADYARKVHKDTGAAKPKPKVFDNDNLPKEDKLSVVGQQPVAEAKPSVTEEAKDKAATPDGKAVVTPKPDAVNPATTTEEEKAKKQAEQKDWQAKIVAQKEQVSMASRELDVTQREYQLRAAAMYADVGNRLRNQVQWDKEEASYKQQLVDKQKVLDDAKQKLEELKDAALKAGVPSSMIE
jgi:LAS superfamily LD-carboxypeptidase LdcB